eukprot:scaffold2945_cov99-Cylindrotheca_fusiformis.AAC.3
MVQAVHIFCRRLALLTLMLVCSSIQAATELSVEVYEGPKECSDDEKVIKGKSLSIHYTGTIDESSATGVKGQKFDSSLDRGSVFEFTIGSRQVITGWEYGLLGLCKGAKATMVIPPIMGYGSKGAGKTIPGDATLHFDVEIVDIADPKDVPLEDEPNFFEWMDTNGDGKLSKEELAAYFSGQGQEMPEKLMAEEDTNGDGFLSWEEFSGPKGKVPPGHDEL